MPQLPSYDEFISALSQKASNNEIDPEVSLFEQPGLDSVDVIEWLYTFEDTYDVTFDESIADLAGTESVRQLYQTISSISA